MGTSRSVSELQAKMVRYTNAIEDANLDAVSKSAQVVKDRILDRARPATGGDLKLSGARNRSVGVSYSVDSRGALVRATGPMHWLEGGTKPHAIVPKALGGSRAMRSSFVANAFGTGLQRLETGKRAALKFPGAGRNGSGFAAYSRRAGGLKAQHVWSEGVEDARRPSLEVFRIAQVKALVQSFT